MSKVTFYKGGPAVIEFPSSVQIVSDNGTPSTKESVVAICRCGRSGDGMFCDGSHTKKVEGYTLLDEKE
jgi:CDGSH-type Zn-finger protein